METVYKLTRPDRTTFRGFHYEVGRRYIFSGGGALWEAAATRAAAAGSPVDLLALAEWAVTASDPFELPT